MIAVLVHDGDGDDFKSVTIEYPPQEFLVEDGKLWEYAGTQDSKAFYSERRA